MAAPLLPGLHLLHKPVGLSSHAAIEAVRAGPGRLCHGGALDPFASGLLLGLAGEATRLFPYLHGIPKVYRAEVRWGVETDTGDPGGAEVARGDPATLSPAALDAALRPFFGWTEQVPPATSNKRIDGERAWVRAARGERVNLPASRVFLAAARWTRHALPAWSELEIEVAGGFYVRALARDLGRALGVGAHLGALERLRIGPWNDPGPDRRVHVQGQRLLPWCPVRAVAPGERRGLAVGADLPLGTPTPAPWPLPDGYPEPPIACFAEGRLLAVGRYIGDTLRVEASFGRGV